MKDAPFNTGFLAGLLVMVGAQAVGWFIQSPSAADASLLRTAAVIVQAVIGFGGAAWLYARERGRTTRTRGERNYSALNTIRTTGTRTGPSEAYSRVPEG